MIMVMIMLLLRLVGVHFQNERGIKTQCDNQFVEFVRCKDMAHLFHCFVKPIIDLHEIVGRERIDYLFIGHMLEQAEGRALGMIRQDLYICGQFPCQFRNDCFIVICHGCFSLF